MTPDPEYELIAEELGKATERLLALEEQSALALQPIEAANGAVEAAVKVLEQARKAVRLLETHVLSSDLGKLSARLELISNNFEDYKDLAVSHQLRQTSETRDLARRYGEELQELRRNLATTRQLAAQTQAALESVETLRPKGTWEAGTVAMKGDVYERTGSSYVSQKDNNKETPAHKSKNWMTLAKRGAPASGGSSAEVAVLEERVAGISVNVADFFATHGGSNDGTISTTAAIQAAHDYVYARGGGFVDFDAGTFLTDATIENNSLVIFRGKGSGSSVLKLADGANCDIFRTTNFATLTGTTTWKVAAGVIHGFGWMGMRIDGNRTNNSSGSGIKLFGKRYLIDDLIIMECAEDGLYTECGNGSGQDNWTDLPETTIDRLYIRSCNGYGCAYLGPHDGLINSLFSAQCGKAGFYQSTADNHSGLVDVRYLHVYANNLISGNAGVEIYGQSRYGLIQSESNWTGGIYIGATSNVGKVMIDGIRCFGNNRRLAAENPNLWIDNVNSVQISSGIIEDDNDGGGALIGSDRVQINKLRLVGSGAGSSTAYGLKLSDETANGVLSFCQFSNIIINAFGTGLLIGNPSGSQPRDSSIEANISDCATLIECVDEGLRNDWKLRGYFTSGSSQTFLSGTFGIQNESSYRISFEDSTTGVHYASREKFIASKAVDLTTNAEQYLLFDYNHWRTPDPGHFKFQIRRKEYTSTTYAIRYAEPWAITPTYAALLVRLDITETPPTALTVSSISAGGNFITTSVTHHLSDDHLGYLTSTGSVPGGTTSGVKYLVDRRDATAIHLLDRRTFEQIDITDAGSGTIKFHPVQNAFAYCVLDSTNA